MAVGFPPQPVYPRGIDSDRTLYLVFSTSEARLAQDNAAWAEEIEIYPVGASEQEIWPENGFASIDGELFYYDAVEKDANGKIYKFKRCARNIGGDETKFNRAGTEPVPGDPEGSRGVWVRGFVVAEHHNQIVDAIRATELFVLDVDERIERLIDEPDCIDDAYCVSVEFDFQIDEDASDNCVGTVATYAVTLTGTYGSFRIDFGDGTYTNSDLTGSHTYPPNSTIDPIITVTSEDCTVVQSPAARTPDAEPEPSEEDEAFNIPIPSPPDFPTVEIPDCDVPVPTLELPQIVFPCLDIPDINIPDINIPNINIPSIIAIIPSLITIEMPPFPSYIFLVDDLPSIITVIDSIPSIITVTDSIPSVITVIDSIPSEITVTIIDSIPSIITVVDSIPSQITVDANVPSQITVVDSIPSTITVVDSIPSAITLDGNLPSEIMVIDSIPSQITVIDSIPSTITLEGCDLPSQITVIDSIPSTITLEGCDLPSQITVIDSIPSTITLEGCDLPSQITVIDSIPSTITLEGCDLPSQITVIDSIPSTITLEGCDLPSQITVTDSVPSTITVTDSIPNSISLTGCNLPSQITVIDSIPSIITVIDNIPLFIYLIDSLSYTINVEGCDLEFSKIQFDDPPTISVDWEPIPTISCDCTVTIEVECAGGGSKSLWANNPQAQKAAKSLLEASEGPDKIVDGFKTTAPKMNMNAKSLGIPSEIKIAVPTFPELELKHDLPVSIALDVPEIPNVEVAWVGPPLPQHIKITAEEVPERIELVAKDIPEAIRLDTSDLPDAVQLLSPKDFPSELKLDVSDLPDSIQVKGIPKSIDVNMPSEIVARLEVPENLEIPLVYKGSPVPVQFDTTNLSGEDGEQPCFALVPCNPNK
jgi:hypothetical protein